MGLEIHCDDCVYIVKFVAKGNTVTCSPSHKIGQEVGQIIVAKIQIRL